MPLKLSLPTAAQLNPRSNAPPYLLEFRSSTGFILTSICLAIFTDACLYGLIVPVLPFSLTERSGIPEEDVQYWTSFLISVFGGAVLITSPIFGWYADRSSSRRWPMLAGLLLLAIGTLMFGIGHNVWMLVASRFLQGVSAANVYTIGLALLVDTVGKDEVGQMMGYALSTAELGCLISPFIGGTVYAKAGWNTLFAIALTLICVDVFLRLMMIEKKVAARYKSTSKPHDEHHEPLPRDVEAGETTSTSRKPAMYDSKASLTSEDYPNSGSIKNVTAVPPHDERQPLLPKRSPSTTTRLSPFLIFLSSLQLLVGLFGAFVQMGTLTAFDTILPLFVKRTFGWNSLQAGVLSLCVGVPALAGPFAGKLADRYGARWVATGGFIAAVPPMLLLGFVNHYTEGQVILLLALLVLTGLALIFTASPLASNLTAIVESMESANPGIFGVNGATAQALSLYNASMAAGTLAFPIVAGVVMQSHGMVLLTALLAATSAVAAMAVCWVLRSGGGRGREK